jgi:Ca2+-binding RTX toxin-like protein
VAITRKTVLRSLVTGVALAVPLAVATTAPAQALTNVTAISGKLSINSGNVGDHISISLEGGFLVVKNLNDTMRAGSFTCNVVDSRTVRCNPTGITNILVNSQGGADTVNNNTSLPLRGFLGPGGDVFNGGSARDFVNGDGENDLLNGRGGNDILIGDAGFDQASGSTGTDACAAEAETSCEQDA